MSDGQRAEAEAITAGGRQAVDVAGIERELAMFWKTASDTSRDPGQAVTRACALNLVAYTESDAEAGRASEIIARVAVQDPCRAIVVVAEPRVPETALSAWISAHCHLPGPGSPQVCCEQITISAQGASVDRVPELILPLLASDLPVVLWWPGEPRLESPIFGPLVNTSDRIVLDSARFAQPCRALARVAALAAGPYHDVAFGDLNWGRLTPWRDLAAQFFDSPEMRPYLLRIDSVAVECCGAPDSGSLNRAQAALLIGWLASRLGWTSETGQPATLGREGRQRLRAPDGATVDVVIESAGTRSDSVGSLVALRLHSAGEPDATFTIARGEDDTCVVTTAHLAGRSPVSRVGRVSASSDEQLLCQELEYLSRDRVFEEALALVGALAGEAD